ncbi:MAG TPA: lipase family protein [Allosphingosinicella sp.]|nr:lipase family protein [Allosphingosinicella sp.]
MTRETCLKRHLLHASVQAYHPDPPFHSGPPRWLHDPVRISPGRTTTPFLNLSRPEIDFALVGRFEEGIVVAFRGTLPPLDLSPDGMRIVNPDIRGAAIAFDWRNNLDAPLVRDFAVGAATLPGRVHRGFAESLARLWGGVAETVDGLRDGSAPRLYFTGHSKGGAIANLAAVCARRIWPAATVKAATFGAARAGDGDFAAAYRSAGIDCHRYEVSEDIVPDLPPAGVEAGSPTVVRRCEPVGVAHQVPLIAYPPPLSLGGLFGRVLRPRDDRWLIRPAIAAHLPYRGFGYGEHVCEEGCRHDWR